MVSESETDSSERFSRYQRQMRLPGFGLLEQGRLFSGAVLILGASFLARSIAICLCQSGVGSIKIASQSLNELSQARQFIGLVEAPDTKISFQLLSDPMMLQIEELTENIDVVVDADSTWQVKLLASDVAMRMRKPLIHSHSTASRCHVYSVVPGRSMCLRCLLTELEMEDYPREEAGSVSSMPALESILAGFQTLEVVKLLSGFGVSQGNELLRIDGLSGELEVLRGLDPSPDCPDCGIPFLIAG